MKQRAVELREARHYFLLSTAAAVAAIILKFIAWWLTGSLALLSDAMESFVNLAGASFALWMITIASHPPDREHPLGHSKAEYFSSGFEGILIFGAAGAIIWSAVHRLLAPQPLESMGIGMAFSGASTLINFAVARSLHRASARFNSVALEGSARHLMTDVWTSVGVVIGLVLVLLTGYIWLDALVAMLVGLHILWEGGRLVKMSADGLMDAALPQESVQAIETVLEPYLERGVSYRNLRTRRAGARSFVYIDVLVPPNWTIVQAHALLDEIEASIQEILPEARVFSHPEPAPDSNSAQP